MSNVIQIKNGASQPSVDNLQPFELGYVRGGALYIKNVVGEEAEIIKLADPRVAELIDENNYLVLLNLVQASDDVEKILVSGEDNTVQYIDRSKILGDTITFSDDGGTINGSTIINGALTANTLIVGPNSWGVSNPNDAEIPGVDGQLYFVLVQEEE